MSDYVRIKAVRYKFNNDILKGLEKEIEERDFLGTPVELYNEKHNLPDYFDHKLNDFTANSGWDFDKKEDHLFLDYLLDYEYGASGDFESVRELTKTEFEKYKEIFKDILPDLKPGELRLVHYSYYNGVDEPSVWNLEEI
jgi:hypothetical protein